MALQTGGQSIMKKMQRIGYGIAFIFCVLCLFFLFSQRQENAGAGNGFSHLPGQAAITQAGHAEQLVNFQKEETRSRLCVSKSKEEGNDFLGPLPFFAVLFSCALVFLFSGETKAALYAFSRRSFLLNDHPIKLISIVQYKDGKKRFSPFI